MKTLLATAASVLLFASTSALASNEMMDRYTVTYVDSVDLVNKQTHLAIENINYQLALDIREQAQQGIDYIGARLHLHQTVALKQDAIPHVMQPETAQ
ncbi:hypothetical protein [Thalassotalea aquiviva]|uniref:hypothetical protein n=1 Tax=Thalassotalea aquiviva TaxID=3242415 RepID=UPI00352B755F